MAPLHFTTRPGERLPPGATPSRGGVNFSVFSRHATSMSLVLYRRAEDTSPIAVFDLDPIENRTFFFWHVFVAGASAGLYYNWIADGPGDTERTGFRFEAGRELLDPCARAVSDALWDRQRVLTDPEHRFALRAQVVDDAAYDWEGDRPIARRPEDTVIYEVHVGGFTRHPSAAVAEPGTFRALVEKIPYLKKLGITDVELLPVMAFDVQDVPDSTAAIGLTNYWGYSPYGFFAPHPGYASTTDARREFRDMVKALHKAGIGVILDVVLNHTAEGGDGGPVIHFKGLANETFYHLEPYDRAWYRDYTGCGNTLNCNHPVVADLLVRCLEYWVQEMHVDGFRFDLASVLVRGEDGEPMYHAPVLWAMEFSRTLAHTKLIAEAWDAGGLYQVGDFPGFRWMEWNGRYRDTVRRFVRGDEDLVQEVATRISGSSDLYQSKGKLPINSINYVTCHDGFTLWDLVSYDEKHNEANGEHNRDGTEENFSWNCGIEGPTRDPDVLKLRNRQARNYIALLLLSQGIPMLRAGDEVLLTQHGNNNAYCQDNEMSWFDWSLLQTNRQMFRFTKKMIALRMRHPSLRRARFLTGKPDSARAGQSDIVWYGTDLTRPDWNDPSSRVLRFTVPGQDRSEGDLHVIANMSDVARSMKIPPAPGQTWYGAIDTSAGSPRDIIGPSNQKPATQGTLRVAERTVVVLESR